MMKTKIAGRPLSYIPSKEEIAQAASLAPTMGAGPKPQGGVTKLLRESLAGPNDIEAMLLADPFRIRIPEGLLRDEPEYADEAFNELVESMRALGRNQEPISVRRIHGDLAHEFELLAGTRRLAAAKALGQKVLVLVRRLDSEFQADLIHEIENRARKSKSLYSIAQRYAYLMQTGRYESQMELAERLGVHQASCNRLLRLIEQAPEGFWDHIEDRNAITWRQVRAILEAFDDQSLADHLRLTERTTIAKLLADIRAARRTETESGSVSEPDGLVLRRTSRGFQIKLPPSVSEADAERILAAVQKILGG